MNDATSQIIRFPIDLDTERREFVVAQVDVRALSRASFIDSRFEFDLGTAEREPIGNAPSTIPRTLHWLFHTSFCCSTLLARLVEAPGSRAVLREPTLLRRLSDMRAVGKNASEWLVPVIARLALPWASCDATIIKPTHAALNVASGLLGASPQSKAVVITSSLDDFLVSNIKKTPGTHAKVGTLVDRALRAGSARHRLHEEAMRPPGLLELVGLQWAVQRELVVDIMREHPGRLMAIDAAELGLNAVDVAARCLAWWNLDVDPAALRERVAQVGNVHAKVPSRPYSAGDRRAEAAVIQATYAGELADAKVWLQRHVVSSMRPEALCLGGAEQQPGDTPR